MEKYIRDEKILLPSRCVKPLFSLVRLQGDNRWCQIGESACVIRSDKIYDGGEVLRRFKPGVLLCVHLSRGGGVFEKIDEDALNHWIRDVKENVWYPVRKDGGIFTLISFSSDTVLRVYAVGTMVRVYIAQFKAEF